MQLLIDRYRHTKVICGAMRQMGDILGPYVANEKRLFSAIEEAEGTDAPQWYPVSIMMELLQVARKNNVLERLAENRALGFVQHLALKNNIQSPLEMLAQVDRAYKTHHKGDAGSLKCRPIGPQAVEFIDTTFYPCEYMTAFLARVVSALGGEDIEREHPEGACMKESAQRCITVLTWKQGELLKMSSQVSVKPS
jgi:hypothetical protein